ncbi:enolase C-terminal domain-like protein [Enterocloster sp.]|uniref:enolase C-terminal domain-like protein n=1 Tax=Enterocloster sp. TaxID=2719315 RepID=UPI00399EECE1
MRISAPGTCQTIGAKHTTLIATGRICTWLSPLNRFAAGALDVVHPDLPTSGGILETKKLGDLAARYGAPWPRICVSPGPPGRSPYGNRQ